MAYKEGRTYLRPNTCHHNKNELPNLNYLYNVGHVNNNINKRRVFGGLELLILKALTIDNGHLITFYIYYISIHRIFVIF